MMRFNTDLNTMEFYNGDEWRQFTYIADIQNKSTRSRGRAINVVEMVHSTAKKGHFLNINKRKCNIDLVKCKLKV